MRFILSICFFLCTLLGGANSGLAQEQTSDSTLVLPNIEVIGLRAGTVEVHAPARVSLVGANTIEATASLTLAELLTRTGSAFVRTYGTGLANISFRGTASSQTLLLVDGIPFSDPQLGQVDLSLLSLLNVEEVQILHGAGSAFYGSQSMGGAINLRTTTAQSPLEIQAATNAGPFGERGGNLAFNASRNYWSGAFSISHQHVEGDFPFHNVSLFPPQTSRREGADRRQASLWGKINRTTARNATSLSAWFNDVERGLPGVSTAVPRDERQWDVNRRLQARHITNISVGLISLSAAIQQNKLRYFNPQIEIDHTSHTTASTLEAEFSSTGRPFNLSVGLLASQFNAEHPSLKDKTGETHVAGFVRSEILQNRIRLFPAIRFDAHLPNSGDRLMSVNPSFGVNIQPIPDYPGHVKARISRAFRAPTFNDRFWQPGGNPLLKPEHGWNYEAGFIYSPSSSNASFELAGFHHQIIDQIIWVPQAGETYWAPENIGRTRATGLDASSTFHLHLENRLSFSIQSEYTFVDARDVTDPNEPTYKQPLRYTPQHVLSLHPALALRLSNTLWKFNVTARRVGRRFITTDGSQNLPAYFNADAHLTITRSITRISLTAGFFLENIFDASYEVVKGYPVPPRTLHIRLAARFIDHQ